MHVESTAELKNQRNNHNQNSSRAGWNFGRVIKGLLVLDAAFILFLMSGFVLPSTPVKDAHTGALPENAYDYSAKVSPLAPPVAESRQPKTEIEVITARGDNPTFVPPPADDVEPPPSAVVPTSALHQPDESPVSGVRVETVAVVRHTT